MPGRPRSALPHDHFRLRHQAAARHGRGDAQPRPLRRARAVPPRDGRVPRDRAAVPRRRRAVPRRLAGRRRARDPGPHRGGGPGHLGRQEGHRHGARQLRAALHRVRVLEGPERGVERGPRRDFCYQERPAGRDEGADHPQVLAQRPPDPLDRAHVAHTHAVATDLPRRPDRRPRDPLRAGRRARGHRRRAGARADDQPHPGRARAVRHLARPGRAGRAGPEPRRARRPAGRDAQRADDPPRGPPPRPRQLQPHPRRARQRGPRRLPRRGRDGRGRRRGGAHARALQRRPGRRRGRGEVLGRVHDDGRRGDHRQAGRDQGRPARRDRAVGRQELRHARRRRPWTTSWRRSSRASS